MIVNAITLLRRTAATIAPIIQDIWDLINTNWEARDTNWED